MSENSEKIASQFIKDQGDIFKCLLLSVDNPKDIQFDKIWNREKQEISISDKLKTAFSAILAWVTTLMIDLCWFID